MTYLRVLVCTGVLAFLPTLNGTVEAGGSSGGYASSGGSSGGGGLLSSWKARMGSRHSGGSSGGSWGSSGGSHGSSGGVVVHQVSHGSHGSSGGVSHGSSGGGSQGSSGGRVGPLKRLVAKIHARKASRGSSGGGSHGSSGGHVSHGSHGSSGGQVIHSSHGSHGSSGGQISHMGHVSYSQPVHSISHGATAVYESPVIESSYQPYSAGETVIESSVVANRVSLDGASQPLNTESSVVTPSAETVEADAAMLTVSVPDGAKVTVNGHPTSSDGTTRQFKSRGLKEGFVYTYVVEVVYNVDGQQKTETKSVKLRPGDNEQVAFEAPVVAKKVVAESDPITVVKLHVPADAQVTLAGNATNGSGEVRTFRTKQLKAGQQWSAYTIRVTKSIGGQSVSKERTVDVAAGSTTELTFEFDDSEIASR